MSGAFLISGSLFVCTSFFLSQETAHDSDVEFWIGFALMVIAIIVWAAS